MNEQDINAIVLLDREPYTILREIGTTRSVLGLPVRESADYLGEGVTVTYLNWEGRAQASSAYTYCQTVRKQLRGLVLQ